MAMGYLVQGGSKFAGYEVFKRRFASIVGILRGQPSIERQSTSVLVQTQNSSPTSYSVPCKRQAFGSCPSVGLRRPWFWGSCGWQGRRECCAGSTRFHPAALQAGTSAVGQFSAHGTTVKVTYRVLGPDRRPTQTQLEPTTVELASESPRESRPPCLAIPSILCSVLSSRALARRARAPWDACRSRQLSWAQEVAAYPPRAEDRHNVQPRVGTVCPLRPAKGVTCAAPGSICLEFVIRRLYTPNGPEVD